MPLQVPIVVTAEDGVTSLRYYVVVTRAVAPEVTVSTAADALGPVSELFSVPLRNATGGGWIGASAGALAPRGGDTDGGPAAAAAPSGGQLTIGAPPGCALDMAQYRRFRKPISDFLRAFQDQRIVPVLYLDDYLCDASACRSHADGVPFYRDAVHFSHSGSRFIGKAMDWGELIAKLAS